MAQGRIVVEGLAEFRRAINSAGAEFGKQLKKGFDDAARLVATSAAAKVPVRTGRLKASIKPRSTAKEGRVALGGGGVPYGHFIEFGGHVGRNHATSRPVIAEGRYLYPSFNEHRPEVQRLAEDVVRAVAEQAGLS